MAGARGPAQELNTTLGKEMVDSVVAAGIAVIGSLIAAWIVARATRQATLDGIARQAEVRAQAEEARTAEERRRLAYSIQAELIALRDRWEQFFRPILAGYQGGQGAPYFSASFEYFPVFDGNADRLGLFDPAHATALVKLYVDLKGFLDTLKSLSEDERSKQSRTHAVGPDVYRHIQDEVNRLHDEGGRLSGPIADAVTMLDVYLFAPDLPPGGGYVPTESSWLSRLWSKLTHMGFLTLLIALGTLATAIVAYQNGSRTQGQLGLLKRQVEFNATETRPFLRLRSRVANRSRSSEVTVEVTNLGRVPGKVIASDVVIQVGRDIIEPHGVIPLQDILYPNQPGLGLTQTLLPTAAKPFIAGAEPLVVAGCVIYGSISTDDLRRWMVSAAYRFDSRQAVPIGLFINEVAVKQDTAVCDASSYRDEWLRLREDAARFTTADATVSITVSVDKSLPALRSLITRLDRALHYAKGHCRSLGSVAQCQDFTFRAVIIDEIRFDDKSSLFPSPNEDGEAFGITTGLGVLVRFYRGRFEPSLELDHNTIGWMVLTRDAISGRILYEYDGARLRWFIDGKLPPEAFKVASVLSIGDLLGNAATAQPFARPVDVCPKEMVEYACDSRLLLLLRATKIELIAFRFPHRRNMFLGAMSENHAEDNLKVPYLFWNVPSTLDSLQEELGGD